MRKMKVIGILFLSGLFIMPICPGTAAAEGLKFVMELDKTEYVPADAISFEFRLENRGDDSVYVNNRFHVMGKESEAKDRDVFLEVTGPSGEKLPCKNTYTKGLPRIDLFSKLEKDESVSSKRPGKLKGYFELDSPGKYKVIAVYDNVYGGEIGLDTFTGKLPAEPVVFEIIEPEEV